MDSTIEEQQRGVLTDRIKNRSVELFGYEISVREFRLFPFIQYTMCNEQQINIERINNEEINILSKYVKLGYIVYGVTERGIPMINTKMVITKKFWDMINEIVYLGYVDTN